MCVIIIFYFKKKIFFFTLKCFQKKTTLHNIFGLRAAMVRTIQNDKKSDGGDGAPLKKQKTCVSGRYPFTKLLRLATCAGYVILHYSL